MGPWRADFVHPQTIIASSHVNVRLSDVVEVIV